MSRHRLPLPNRAHVIVGYDRPVGAYFCQVWEQGVLEPTMEDDCLDLDEFVEYYAEKGLKFPAALRETLVKEACGESDTNVCKTWKWEG